MRYVRVVAVAFLLASLVPAVAAQTKKPKQKPFDRGILKPLSALLDDLNKMKKDFPAELFAEQTAVVDDFPPYAWPGPNGAQDWYKTFIESAEADKSVTEQVITMGEPMREPEFKDNRAYLTVPVTIKWKQDGKPKKEIGPWTVVVEKKGDGWVIVSHSFHVTSETP